MLPTDKLPANSRPLYRICTKKSRLGFGKYADMTVGDVLKLQPEYIVYLYAMKPDFSLHADILAELGLRAIHKPGTDEEVLHEYRIAQREGLTDEQIMHGKYKRKLLKQRKAVGKLLAARQYTTFRKGELQSANHGHGLKHKY